MHVDKTVWNTHTHTHLPLCLVIVYYLLQFLCCLHHPKSRRLTPLPPLAHVQLTAAAVNQPMAGFLSCAAFGVTLLHNVNPPLFRADASVKLDVPAAVRRAALTFTRSHGDCLRVTL